MNEMFPDMHRVHLASVTGLCVLRGPVQFVDAEKPYLCVLEGSYLVVYMYT